MVWKLSSRFCLWTSGTSFLALSHGEKPLVSPKPLDKTQAAQTLCPQASLTLFQVPDPHGSCYCSTASRVGWFPPAWAFQGLFHSDKEHNTVFTNWTVSNSCIVKEKLIYKPVAPHPAFSRARCPNDTFGTCVDCMLFGGIKILSVERSQKDDSKSFFPFVTQPIF